MRRQHDRARVIASIVVCSLFVVIVVLTSVMLTVISVSAATNTTNSTKGVPTAPLNITCGNDICETGENSDNCPGDCLSLPYEFSTNFISPSIIAGNEQKFEIRLKNRLNRSITLKLSFSDSLSDFMKVENSTVVIKANERRDVILDLAIPKNQTQGVLSGDLIISYNNKQKRIPLKIMVIEYRESLVELNINALTKELGPTDTLYYNVVIYSYVTEPINISMTLRVKDFGNNTVLFTNTTELTNLESSRAILGTLPLNSTRFTKSFTEGAYYLEASTEYNGVTVLSSSEFSVGIPFWTPGRIRVLGMFIALIVIAVISLLIYRKYNIWKLDHMRYVPPQMDKIPKKKEGMFKVGKIPEMNKGAYMDPRDLTTHCLVAGSTGSGKSVTASIIAEEALLNNIPVIVFDPTNQWTGFVKRLSDKRILSFYPEFNLTEEDARSFKGLIYDVTSPEVNINIQKFMNPGEITVFNLSGLRPGEYDIAVMHIVDKIFTLKWPETHDLKVFLVFDEVHRLLEKYGGKGGYVALEKACREFRKWGLGILMISQVSADFKEAVAGNILTEVQLNTKCIEDIDKIASKYGPEYSSKITRQGIGVGLIQNPRYNDGKPWFIHFRPPLHNPHKISEEELKQYSTYSVKLDDIEAKLTAAKTAGKDVTDIELELKLTRNKLKEGHFKMVDLYIKSLEDNSKKL